MAIQDAALQLATDLDLDTSVAGPAPFGPQPLIVTPGQRSFDMLTAQDYGMGEELTVEFEVTESFASGGAPVIHFGISTADEPLEQVGATGVVHLARTTGGLTATEQGFPVAQLESGFKTYLTVPRFTTTNPGSAPGTAAVFKRYMNITVWQPDFATLEFTAGKISARILLTPNRDLFRDYASGFSIT